MFIRKTDGAKICGIGSELAKEHRKGCEKFMTLCIFDLDGTLTDTLTAISHFGNLALSECGFKTFEKDRYRRFVGDGRTKLIERMLDAQDALTDENFKTVCAVYDGYYEADPLYKTDAYDGIRELLERLRENGVRLAVCSNKPDNVVRDVVCQVFGDGVFDCITGMRDGMKTKPNPDSANAIMKALSADRDGTFFIGDTNVDIFTAKNAGVKSIGVLWGFRDLEELTDAGADYIAKTPEDILNTVFGGG